jgi:hypothetical protein
LTGNTRCAEVAGLVDRGFLPGNAVHGASTATIRRAPSPVTLFNWGSADQYTSGLAHSTPIKDWPETARPHGRLSKQWCPSPRPKLVGAMEERNRHTRHLTPNPRSRGWRTVPDQDFWFYARSFHAAAKQLAEAPEFDSGAFADFAACPVVFMYRHASDRGITNWRPARPRIAPQVRGLVSGQ